MLVDAKLRKRTEAVYHQGYFPSTVSFDKEFTTWCWELTIACNKAKWTLKIARPLRIESGEAE